MNLVYLLRAGDSGPVHIGSCTAKGFHRRLDSIQRHNPEIIYIVELLDGDERLERHLHVLLDQHQVRGDWYDPACLADIPAEIERLDFDADEEDRRIAALEMADLLADR